MSFAPDFGLRMLREGASREMVFYFIPFEMAQVSRVDPGGFTTISNIEHAGEFHALSLDFDTEVLNEIRCFCDEEDARRLAEAVSADWAMGLTVRFEQPLSLAVTALLGEVQSAPHEQFVPLRIQSVSLLPSLMPPGNPWGQSINRRIMKDQTEPASEAEPRWEFPALPHVDLIGEENASAVAFLFHLSALEEVASIYSDPPLKALLAGLKALGESKNKKLRESAFTVFAGDALDNDVFVVAVGTESSDLVSFLAPYFRAVPGYYCLEGGTSKDFLPVYRYDHGYVIRYAENGLEGTTYMDDEDYMGSGLKIYRRAWMVPEQAGVRKTTYGRLMEGAADG